MRMTHHLWVASGILLLALVATVSPLITSGGSYPTPITVQKVPIGSDHVVKPAKDAVNPLVAAYDVKPEHNPFTLRTGGGRVRQTLRIELPPPPPLDPPAPPIMPLPLTDKVEKAP